MTKAGQATPARPVLADNADISGATATAYTLTDADAGAAVKVRVSFTDDAGNEESLTSSATNPVVVPLTASLHDAPESHDGRSPFTFELRFNEEFGISYLTLRDHAFNATGGAVLKAQRTNKPSNIPWRITVQPDFAGDEVIDLPATTDCEATGAINIEDGRKLSRSLNFAVSRPSQWMGDNPKGNRRRFRVFQRGKRATKRAGHADMQRRLPPPRANEALPARVLAGGTGAHPTHPAAPAGKWSRRDEAQTHRSQGEAHPRRRVGVAGRAGHLTERTGPVVRTFLGILLPTDERNKIPVAQGAA